MNTARLFFILWLLVPGLCGIFPQSLYAQRYPFYNLNVENGLIQSQPRAIAEDSLGHLWIATLGGLSRYDGKHFVNYTAKDGLPGNYIRALAFDTTGHLWIGGVDGLCRFDGKVFRKIPLPADLQNDKNAVRQIAVDSRGVVWLLASGRLYFVQDDSARLVGLPFKNTAITAFLPNRSRLLLTTANGMAYQYYQHQWDSLALQARAGGNPPLVHEIFKDSKGRIWLASNQGLLLWQSGNIHNILPAAAEAHYPVYTIAEDKGGKLWLGCAKGAISIQENGSVRYYDKKNGLSDNSFFSLFCDRAGNIWMASDGQGIFRFSGAPFTVVDETSGLGSGQIMSMSPGPDDAVYLGTYDAGLYLYKNGSAHAVALPDKSFPAITALDYHNGILWLGTRGQGLWRWDGNSLSTYRSNSLPSNYIVSLYRDKAQNLWVGTTSGAARMTENGFQILPAINSDVQAFLEWNQDSLLITGSEGLWLYERGRVAPFVTNTILDSLRPQCLARTGDLLWAGTSDNGVVIYSMTNRKSLVLNTESGLRSDFIYNLLVDRQGSVWIGTGFGVHRISGYQTQRVQIIIYGSGQGIAGMESNHNASMQTSDGTVWMGTTAGAMLFTSESSAPLAQNTAIVLQAVNLPGQAVIPAHYYDSLSPWYGTPKHLSLPYRQNTISFTYQSLALAHQGQVRYRHRLLGLETAWSPWLEENTITYSALPPGDYTLQVQSGIEGSAAPVSTLDYAFTIQTPFHKSVWFRVLLVFFLILTGITIQYILGRRRRRLQEMIRALRAEEQNRVRQRTAEDFHDEVGNRITRITVLTQVLRNKLSPLTEDNERILGKIQENASLLYNGTRDILWALKPENDNLYELLQRLNELGADLFRDTAAAFYFAGARENWRTYKLPMDVNRNLMMIFKEAMNNCLKYAAADKVHLIAEVSEDKMLTLVLEDDGKGFLPDEVSRGQGLQNMKRRAARIGGRLELESSTGSGTVIRLHLPLAAFLSSDGEEAPEDAGLFATLKRVKKSKPASTAAYEHPDKSY